jgi:outer membrane lipoprotein
MNRVAVCVTLALFAAACAPLSAVPPGPAAITVTRARVESLVGQHVRWGGEVADVHLTEHETCFEIIDRPLASNGEPLDTERTDGRFLACTPQFYARALYQGKDVTVTGTLEAPEIGKLLELNYRYPRVRIGELQFWPQAQNAFGDRYRSGLWSPWGAGSRGYWW